jgi:hypothetical protein
MDWAVLYPPNPYDVDEKLTPNQVDQKQQLHSQLAEIALPSHASMRKLHLQTHELEQYLTGHFPPYLAWESQSSLHTFHPPEQHHLGSEQEFLQIEQRLENHPIMEHTVKSCKIDCYNSYIDDAEFLPPH